jgi:hypothetical protein
MLLGQQTWSSTGRSKQADLETGRIFGGRYHEAAAASRQKTAVSPLRPPRSPSPFVPSRR